MTRYILIGGYTSRAPDGGKALCMELVKGFDQPVKILFVFFALPKKAWSTKLNETKQLLMSNVPDTQLDVRMADYKNMVQLCQWANVIYFSGGKMDPLYKALDKNKEWMKTVDGKTVAGSSAGAIMLSRYSYDPDNLCVIEGRGLLPVKVIVHYQSGYNAPHVNWDKAYQELEGYKEKLEIAALPEGQFRVFETKV